MASGETYRCNQCRFDVMVWSDGNPFYRDEKGAKHYAYHPNHDLLDRCIGNDPSRLCRSCLETFIHDSDRPAPTCAKCGSADTLDLHEIAGTTCPKCQKGKMTHDPNSYAIS
jgi:nitrous oxidase accessory protein NosD